MSGMDESEVAKGDPFTGRVSAKPHSPHTHAVQPKYLTSLTETETES